MRGCLRAAGEVQHEHDLRDQLDGRVGQQAEEPGGAGGRQSQGGLGETCGKSTSTCPNNFGNYFGFRDRTMEDKEIIAVILSAIVLSLIY